MNANGDVPSVSFFRATPPDMLNYPPLASAAYAPPAGGIVPPSRAPHSLTFAASTAVIFPYPSGHAEVTSTRPTTTFSTRISMR